jgi:hypothetical protein
MIGIAVCVLYEVINDEAWMQTVASMSVLLACS